MKSFALMNIPVDSGRNLNICNRISVVRAPTFARKVNSKINPEDIVYSSF